MCVVLASVFVCVCVHVCTQNIKRAESSHHSSCVVDRGQLMVPVLSVHHVSHGDQVQVRLGGKHPYPLNQPTHP